MSATVKTQARLLLLIILMAHACAGSAQPMFDVPRSESLARANIAEIGGTEHLYLNPATLAFLERTSLFVSHVHGDAKVPMTQNAAFPLFVEDDFALAMGFALSSFGYLSTPNGRHVLAYGVDVAGGYEFAPRASIGATLSLRNGMSAGLSTSTVSSSFGFLYSPSPEISYALALQGAGTGVGFTSGEVARGTDEVKLDRRLVVGLSMRYPSSASLRRPILVISLSNEKILKRDGKLVYRGGIETFPVDFLALRVGYTVAWDTSVPAFGAGVVLDPVRVDYCFARERSNTGIHGASLSLEF